MKASTAASRPPPNVSGGQVGKASQPQELILGELSKNEQHVSQVAQLSCFLSPLLARLHAHRLRALLRLHQIRHRTERTLPRAEGRSAAD